MRQRYYQQSFDNPDAEESNRSLPTPRLRPDVLPAQHRNKAQDRRARVAHPAERVAFPMRHMKAFIDEIARP